MKINVPENLTLEELILPDENYTWLANHHNKLKLSFVKGHTLLKYIDKMYYFLYLIHRNSCKKYYQCELFQYREFTNVKLSSDLILPYKTMRQIIHFLIEIKVIDSVNVSKVYQYGRVDLKYFRLKYPYNNLNRRMIEIKLKNKKHKINAEIMKNPIYKNQYDKMNDMNFDANKAETLAQLQYCESYNLIEEIRQKNYYFTVGDKSNRVFSTINSIPKQLRCCIVDDNNKSLKELDFHTFNPKLLYYIINEYVLKNNVKNELLTKELEQYRLDLKTDFYMHIACKCLSTDRKKAKDLVLIDWINANPMKPKKAQQILARLYPEITKVMNEMKGITEREYKSFYCDIMKLESHIINDVIYAKFIELYPDAIIYTIFDGMLIEEHYYNYLKFIMENEATKIIGIDMNVK